MGSVRLCWGCEPATILAGPSEALVIRGSDGQLSSVIVQRGQRVSMLASLFSGGLADAELAALLRHAAGKAAGLLLYNEPEESPYLARYRALGFTEFFSQYEMVKIL